MSFGTLLRSLLISLAAFVAAAASARPDPGPSATPAAICAFRLATAQALLGAAGEIDLGREALGVGDLPGAGTWLAAALERLDREQDRVGAEGITHLGRDSSKLLEKALAKAASTAKKAARGVARKPATAESAAAALAVRLAQLLGEQNAAFAGLDCAGGELRVPRLLVAAGDTLHMLGGSTIVAEQGIELLGDLILEGTSADGLTLVAETGDIVLEGGIDASGHAPAAAPLTTTSLVAFALGAAAPAALPQVASASSCGDGRPVEIAAHAGDILIGATYYAIAGDGASCPPLLVTEASQLDPEPAGDRLDYHGRTGGHGGDVHLLASGTIRFAARSVGGPAPFSPGSGGAGESLEFAASFESPPFAELGFRGGAGGASGKLLLDAPAVTGLDQLPRIQREGAGGDGGQLSWDQRAGSALFSNGLTQLFVVGGNGGFGAAKGGRGGGLRYQGDRVVNEVGAPVTAVLGKGGDGGGRRISWYGPLDVFEGGAGGDADVVGHRGWSGADADPDGGLGGETDVFGGTGGTHDPGEACGTCSAGDGGHASGTSGAGGDGKASCTAPPGAGGNGGAGGLLIVSAGDGGDSNGGTGGDGGSVLRADTGVPGRGGQGLPPGVCGEEGISFLEEGAGGEGATLGATGTLAEPGFGACIADNFAPCGAPDCAHPWSLNSFHYDKTYSDLPSWVERSSVDAVESCAAEVCGIWHSSVRTTRTNPNTGDPEDFNFEIDALVIPGLPYLLAHCTDAGALHADGNGTDTNSTSTVTHSCSGKLCTCSGTFMSCCPRATGGGFDPC